MIPVRFARFVIVAVKFSVDSSNSAAADEIVEEVDKYLKNALFTFPGTGEAIMVHDGSATEWQIKEDVMIGIFKVEVFKIVRDNKGDWFITLPISEEQGIGVLELHSDKEIRLPLTLERKEDG